MPTDSTLLKRTPTDSASTDRMPTDGMPSSRMRGLDARMSGTEAAAVAAASVPPSVVS